jgi:hypothetical protein
MCLFGQLFREQFEGNTSLDLEVFSFVDNTHPDESGDGPPHVGAQDSHDHTNSVEERSVLRRRTTEKASVGLNVSAKESAPAAGIMPGDAPSDS